MEDFFTPIKLANKIWPDVQRKSFCHLKRKSLPGEVGCFPQKDNPFASFWNTFGVDFVGSELYGNVGLHHDVSYPQSSEGTHSINPLQNISIIILQIKYFIRR